MDLEEIAEATFRFQVAIDLERSVISPPCYIRNLLWKIKAVPETDQSKHSSQGSDLKFYLQCRSECESPNWSCYAKAELKLISHIPDVETICKTIQHLFCSKKNTSGDCYFISWNDIRDPLKGYIKDDTVTLEVKVTADAPHGVSWDSKKYTGYIGMSNTEKPRYATSLLQILYFLLPLRKAVYKIPIKANKSQRSAALTLQRLFYDLQYSNRPVCIQLLMETVRSAPDYHNSDNDIIDLLLCLLKNLDSEMEGTSVEGAIPLLFEGKQSYNIKCNSANVISICLEKFGNIDLPIEDIKDSENIYNAFEKYVNKYIMINDNTDENGISEDAVGPIFTAFPPILLINLQRFGYVQGQRVKINERLEFYEHLNLDNYLEEKPENPADYILYAVLARSGYDSDEDYVAYINPKGDGKWCKFDDEVVSRCTKQEVIEDNYGGVDEVSLRPNSIACVLVYIRSNATHSSMKLFQSCSRDSSLLWPRNDIYIDFPLFADMLKDIDNIGFNRHSYKCHVCDIKVPIMFSQQHNASLKHKVSKNIIKNCLDSVKRHLEIKFENDESNPSNIIFCENCTVVVKQSDFHVHEMSEDHKKNAIKDATLASLNLFSNLVPSKTNITNLHTIFTQDRSIENNATTGSRVEEANVDTDDDL